MKKKLFAGMLATTMGLALALPVYAEDKTTDLKADVPSSYTLTIPEKTDISYGSESVDLKGILKVSGNVRTTEIVKVSAVSNPLTLVGGTETLPYTLKSGENPFTSATWSETDLRDGLAGAGKSFQLSVAIDKTVWETAKAGTYNGGIVFTAELK